MRDSDQRRLTLSFYQYHQVKNPQLFRDHLFTVWAEIGVLGRVYIAHEGINAQISVPKEGYDQFENSIADIAFLNGIRMNMAIEDDGKSFFQLKIKVRAKIVADGLNDHTFDVTDKGTHLNAEDFNKLSEDPDAVIVDMRNHYESEIGHFENAICPDVDTFREALPVVAKMLKDKKDKKIIMYCTGGIRCEKASAYYKHIGFKNVFQLEGGIIEYARQVQRKGLKNKFRGKNFVFDERLGEKISEEVISKCHQCGTHCDTHTNCKNEACHLLFIQCEACAKKHEGCCSTECNAILNLPEAAQKDLRKGKNQGRQVFKKGRSERLGIKIKTIG